MRKKTRKQKEEYQLFILKKRAKAIRNDMIRADRKKGISIKMLVNKYRLSDDWIRKVCKKTNEELEQRLLPRHGTVMWNGQEKGILRRY